MTQKKRCAKKNPIAVFMYHVPAAASEHVVFLPSADVVSQHGAVIGVKGSGKTWQGGVRIKHTGIRQNEIAVLCISNVVR